MVLEPTFETKCDKDLAASDEIDNSNPTFNPVFKVQSNPEKDESVKSTCDTVTTTQLPPQSSMRKSTRN